MKYDLIQKCTLVSCDYEDKFEDVYILTSTEDLMPHELEIDLSDDMWFNTGYYITKRQNQRHVKNITDLLFFIHEHEINISNKVLDIGHCVLLVGGGNDYVLDYNLNGLGWKDEDVILEEDGTYTCM